MAKLHYITNASLDFFVEDQQGRFDWSVPDEELHAFFADLIRPMSTYLYGRRMYETMAVWETDPALAAESLLLADFAEIWQGADKVVYSRTLDEVATGRTLLERDFDPDAVRAMKENAGADIAVGGSQLAAQALSAGLVDECHVVVHPVLIGGGKPALPTESRIDLDLLEARRVGGHAVYLRYRVRN